MDDSFIMGDNPLMVYQKPLSLRDLSRNAVCLELWRRRIAQGIKNWHTVEINVDQLVPLPQQLRDLVKESIEPIRVDAFRWSATYEEAVLRSTHRGVSRTELISQHFDDLVRRADGSIDEYATAKVLVKSDKLDIKSKYTLACFYCLEDQVKSLWPLLDCRFANAPHKNTSLLYYWKLRMRNEISAEHPYDENSPEHRILLHSDVNWPAVEYLWNRVRPQDRVREAIFILRHKSHFSFDLLPKLNYVELDAVISEVPCEIANCLGYGEMWIELAFRTWKYMCHWLSAEQLTDVLLCFIGKCSEVSDMTDFVLEAWRVSPEYFRYYVRQNRVKELVEKFTSECACGTDPIDVRFIIDLLSSNNVEMNAQIWHNSWTSLLFLTTPDNFRKIMQLCFRDEPELVTFQSGIKYEQKVKCFCLYLMACGRYHDLMAFSQDYAFDKTAIEDLVRYTLKGIDPYFFFYPYEEKCTGGPNLSTFLDLFFDDYLASRKFKLSYVFSSGVKKWLKWCVSNQLYECVMYVIDEYTFSGRTRRSFVKTLLNYSLITFSCTTRLSELRKFKTFFIWCGLPLFKDKLPIDDVIRLLLTRTIKEREFVHYDEGLEDVDDFLLWYFGSYEKVREYKLERIYAYEECMLLSSCLRTNDRCVTDKLLTWFFDGDRGKIGEFMVEVWGKWRVS